MPIYSSEKNFCPAVKEPKCSHIKSTATPAFLVGCKESIITFQTIKINISFQAYSSANESALGRNCKKKTRTK